MKHLTHENSPPIYLSATFANDAPQTMGKLLVSLEKLIQTLHDEQTKEKV